jgi:hypothetical protein
MHTRWHIYVRVRSYACSAIAEVQHPKYFFDGPKFIRAEAKVSHVMATIAIEKRTIMSSLTSCSANKCSYRECKCGDLKEKLNCREKVTLVTLQLESKNIFLISLSKQTTIFLTNP